MIFSSVVPYESGSVYSFGSSGMHPIFEGEKGSLQLDVVPIFQMKYLGRYLPRCLSRVGTYLPFSQASRCLTWL